MINHNASVHKTKKELIRKSAPLPEKIIINIYNNYSDIAILILEYLFTTFVRFRFVKSKFITQKYNIHGKNYHESDKK